MQKGALLLTAWRTMALSIDRPAGSVPKVAGRRYVRGASDCSQQPF